MFLLHVVCATVSKVFMQLDIIQAIVQLQVITQQCVDGWAGHNVAEPGEN